MFTFPIFRRQDDRPTSRRPIARRRRPLVEDLEGRQLLSTFTAGVAGGNGQSAAMVVGSHIGSAAMVVGSHIGSAAMVEQAQPYRPNFIQNAIGGAL